MLFTEMYSEMTRELTLSGYVGFDNLPKQIVKKRLQENFIFNVLCVGETGLGKSTLISSLFNMEIDISSIHKHTNSSVSLKTRKYDIKEKEVPLKLSVTETVGYGDQINKEGNFEPIVNYVDSQFEKYLREELKIKRNLAGHRDTRIHVCLYFICPTGQTLKAADLLAMKYLSSKINVVPIIAKADILTKAELENFKLIIRKELQKENIEIYQFPPENETESTNENGVPFAVVGSMDFVLNDGKLIRGRNYPWGIVFIDNEDHSDFVKLRELLVELHMEDLINLTHTKHFESYRKERLKQCGFENVQHGDGQLNLLEILDTKTEEMRRHLQAEEEEIRQSFIERAKNTENELAEEEQRIKLKYRTVQDQYKEEQKILDEEKRILQQDIDLLHKKKREFAERKKKAIKHNASKHKCDILLK